MYAALDPRHPVWAWNTIKMIPLEREHVLLPSSTFCKSQDKPLQNSFMKQSSSLLEQVIIHTGPVAGASWENFLVYNISEEWGSPERGYRKRMFYSSRLSFGVACFVLCLMFLVDTGVYVCLVDILVSLSTVPPLSSLLFVSLCIDVCLCVCVLCTCLCGCFFPGEMKSGGPYVMQQ